jgi:hypothetical protein
MPETLARQNGKGPDVDLGQFSGKQLLLTLGVTRIIEQESLDVEIWGSEDGATWGDKPVLRFPQKFYCGTYSMVLSLASHPTLKYLRVVFKMNRWGRGDAMPLFGFYVFAEEAAKGVQSATSLHAAVA